MAGNREALMKKFNKEKKNPKWNEATDKAYYRVININKILDDYKTSTTDERKKVKDLRSAIVELNSKLTKLINQYNDCVKDYNANKENIKKQLDNAKTVAVKRLSQNGANLNPKIEQEMFYTVPEGTFETIKIPELSIKGLGKSKNFFDNSRVGRCKFLQIYIDEFEAAKKEWKKAPKKSKNKK